MTAATLDLIRSLVLLGAGVAALAYALWPPTLETPYLTLAGALLGSDPMIRAARLN